MNKILALTVLVLAGFASSQSQNPKIIGGEDAKKNELPYQVQLLFDKDPYCGGSIMNENYILTAGNCVYGTRKSRFTVIAGEHDISSPTNDGTEQSRSVDEILVHENYDPDTQENDIALLKLSSPLGLSDAVGPIALPKQGHLATGMALVSGWGSVTPIIPDTIPAILQKLAVPIITKEVCKAKFVPGLADDKMCAGYEKGGKDVCRGDLGGPLAAYDADNETYLVGVVNYAPRVCAEVGYPGLYANVSHFLTWINQKMESESGQSWGNKKEF